MSQFWSPIVRRLSPYVPGEQPAIANVVKLNTNENPYGPSPKALAAIREEADTLRLYPDPTARRLREAIARRYGVGADHIFVGNGSDEVLAHTFHALLHHTTPVLFPDVTYSFYPTFCALYGVPYRVVPVSDAFEIDVDAYVAPSGGIVIANPNAPTGRALGLPAIVRLLHANPATLVVVDEAYVDFGGESAIALVGQFSNLLVIQTLSKSRSLAGLRVGFAIGHPGLIEGLVRVKDSFNSYPLGRLAIAGAVAAIEDGAWFETTRRAVMASRDHLAVALQSLGMLVIPSSANFVFARHPTLSGAALAASLRNRGIVVRHFPLARIDPFVRITVGTDAQCGALIDALRDLLRAEPGLST